jgi:argininosuccinate synthase
VKERALLLYSGGLDTSVMIKWLQEEKGYDVVTLTLDVGQEKNDLAATSQKAQLLGAIKSITHDSTNRFANTFISMGIMSNGLYSDKYPLSTSLARPLMSELAVTYAHQNTCGIIVHGSTGKGNDQIRFEVSIKALDDSIKVIAPVREMNMNREEEIEYAVKRGIDIPYGGKYSVDENLWGRSVEGSSIEDISKPVPVDAYRWVKPLDKAADYPQEIAISFDRGIPCALDGRNMSLKLLITKINEIAGMNGIGAIDIIEDRVVGIKSHEFYECPAAMTIIDGHKYLESAVLSKRELKVKKFIDEQFSEMVYGGLWHDPLMDYICGFEKDINEPLSGTVHLTLYKGNIIHSGIESSNSLYDPATSTYGRGQTFDQKMAPGFIYVYGASTVASRKARNKQIQKIRLVE